MQPQYYNLKRENFHKIRRQIRSNNSNNKNNNDSNIENNIKGNLNHHQHQVHNSLEEKEFSILLSSNEINQDISSVSTIETTTTTAIAAANNNNYNSTTTIKSIASLSNPFDYYSEITNDSLVTTSLPNLMTTSGSSKNLQDKKNFTLSSTSAGGTKGTGYIIQNVTTSSRPTPPPPPPPTLPTNHFNHKHQVNLNNEKRPTIIIYPTVSPESIVIPIVSCILGFPILALMVICCLRRRAKIARERDRRRHYDMEGHAVSLVRFSPIHRLNNRSPRVVSLCSERSLSRGFPSLELDTVVEERSSDHENTQTDIISPESPSDVVNQPKNFQNRNS